METQTSPILTKDQATEPQERRDVGVQADDGGPGGATGISITPEGLSLVGWAPTGGVRDFLSRVGPRMEAALREGGNSVFFGSPLSFGGGPVDGDDGEAGCVTATCVRFVQPSDDAAAAPTKAAAPPAATATPAFIARTTVTGEPVRGSAVAWNASGTVLAAGFARGDHAGWCNHRTAIALFEPARWKAGVSTSAGGGGGSGGEGSGSEASATSSTSTAAAAAYPAVRGCSHALVNAAASNCSPVGGIELSCCVTALAFHPEQPGLLAGGLYSGEVVVWDVNKVAEGSSDATVARSAMDDAFHRDAVVAVRWVRDPATRDWLLASAGGEGKVHVWSLVNKLAFPLTSLQPATRQVVAATTAGGDDDDDSEEEGGGGGAGAARRARARRGGAAAGGGTVKWLPTTLRDVAFPLGGDVGSTAAMGTAAGALMTVPVAVPTTSHLAARAAASGRPSGRRHLSTPWNHRRSGHIAAVGASCGHGTVAAAAGRAGRRVACSRKVPARHRGSRWHCCRRRRVHGGGHIGIPVRGPLGQSPFVPQPARLCAPHSRRSHHRGAVSSQRAEPAGGRHAGRQCRVVQCAGQGAAPDTRATRGWAHHIR